MWPNIFLHNLYHDMNTLCSNHTMYEIYTCILYFLVTVYFLIKQILEAAPITDLEMVECIRY